MIQNTRSSYTLACFVVVFFKEDWDYSGHRLEWFSVMDRATYCKIDFILFYLFLKSFQDTVLCSGSNSNKQKNPWKQGPIKSKRSNLKTSRDQISGDPLLVFWVDLGEWRQFASWNNDVRFKIFFRLLSPSCC